MAAQPQINRTIANYKGFPNMSFPLECDGLNDSQMNDALLSILGNIGGNKYILTGLTSSTNFSGYVFLATDDFPLGELLYVESASVMQTHLCLRKVNENITASGYQYNNAYTKRTLYHGVPSAGVESFARSGFTQLETNASLKSRIDTLQTQVNNIVPTPKGGIIMWSGTTPPSGWEMCDGGYSNALGKNRPDLKGKFIVGYDQNDPDYNAIGKTGGEKKHILIEDEIPPHTHTIGRDYIEAIGSANIIATRQGINPTSGYFTTSSFGGSNGNTVPHENRPPYYVLAYIIKI